MSDSDENEDEPNVANDINERISNFGRTFCASEYDDENCSEDGDDLGGNGDSDIDALRDKVKNACTSRYSLRIENFENLYIDNTFIQLHYVVSFMRLAVQRHRFTPLLCGSKIVMKRLAEYDAHWGRR